MSPSPVRTPGSTSATQSTGALPPEKQQQREREQRLWESALNKMHAVMPGDIKRMSHLIAQLRVPADGLTPRSVSQLRSMLPHELRGTNANAWELLEKLASDSDGNILCRVRHHEDGLQEHTTVVNQHEYGHLERVLRTRFAPVAAVPAVASMRSSSLQNTTLDEWTAAAASGEHHFLRLLHSKVGIPQSDTKLHGEPLLSVAAFLGLPETATLALNAGADLNARDSRGRTALMRAVSEKKTEVVELLLSRGAEIKNEAEPDKPDALAIAASVDSPDMFKRVLDANGTLTNDAYGLTLCQHVIGIGDARQLDWLLAAFDPQAKAAITPNLVDAFGRENNREMLGVALSHHPDLNTLYGPMAFIHQAVYHQQHTALDALLAEFAKHPDRVNLDIQTPEELMTATHIAVLKNDLVSLRKLTATRLVNVDTINIREQTPLMMALKRNHFEAASLLVDYGCNLEVGQGTTGTALHLVAQLPDEENADALAKLALLLEAEPPAQVDATDAGGRTALHYTVSMADMGKTAMLIASGANVNIPAFHPESGLQLTALHLAIEKIDLPLISLLLDADADPGLDIQPGLNALGLARYFLGKLPPAQNKHDPAAVLQHDIIPALEAKLENRLA